MIPFLRSLLPILTALAWLWLPGAASAHESLPIVVEVRQVDAARFAIDTRYPGNLDMAARPDVALDGPCRNSRDTPRLFTCETAPRAIVIEPGETAAPSAILLRFFARGHPVRNVTASPGTQRIVLPEPDRPAGAESSAPQVLQTYFGMGLRHILLGLDHLLFLTCLVLVAVTPRRVLITVTGFTIGHALTISLASLGFIEADSGAVEAVIALSIAYLAAEIVRGNREGLAWRHPASVAALFGTLHGLGFASALREIGLARGEVALSLVGFNLGVEAGQVLFVIGLLLIFEGVRRAGIFVRLPGEARGKSLATVLAAAIGIVAGYWTIERTIAAIV